MINVTSNTRRLALCVPVWLGVGAIVFAISGDLTDGLLSAGIGLVVTMLVVLIFDQPGTVELSPQRQVAIATGHADRRTLFEYPWSRPPMMVLLSLTHRLALPRFKAWLRRRLVAEGNVHYYTPEEYMALSLAMGLAAGGFLEILYVLLGPGGQVSFLIFLIGLILGVFLSFLHVHEQASKRLRTISKRVPYTLDLISLAMGAGATFTEAVETVIREDPEDPFNVELRTVLSEMELGATRRTALQNMAQRIPLENLRSIIASVIQAEELGTPLSDVLHAQASLLRLQRTVRAENAAAVASVRILIPALLILIGVVITVFGPAIIRATRGGLF